MDPKKGFLNKEARYDAMIQKLDAESALLLKEADAILLKGIPKKDPKKDTASTTKASGSIKTSAENSSNSGAIPKRNSNASKYTHGAISLNKREDEVPHGQKPRQSRYEFERGSEENSSISAAAKAVIRTLKMENKNLSAEIERLEILAKRNSEEVRALTLQQKAVEKEKQASDKASQHLMSESRKFQNMNVTLRASLREKDVKITELSKELAFTKILLQKQMFSNTTSSEKLARAINEITRLKDERKKHMEAAENLKKTAEAQSTAHEKTERLLQKGMKTQMDLVKNLREQKEHLESMHEARNIHVKFENNLDTKRKH